MRKMQSLLIAAIMVAALAFSASDASAGFKLKWDDDTYLDLGGRLQIFAVSANDTSLNGDPSNFENRTDFQIRRARFRLGAQANSFMGFFLQTDVSGRDMKMIDAYIKIKASKALQLGAGLIMAPALRQNITSSGTLMTIARPSLTRKSLPWGLKNGTTFNTKSFGDSGAKGAGKVGLGVRDAGLTLWGVIDTSDTVHMKYYLGLYNGAQSGIEGAGRNDNFHYTARYQVSFGDSESKYFHASTYFGKKDVITIGAAYDWQDDLMKESAKKIDYKLYTVDFFMEKMGMTVEAAYINMDLGEDVSDTNLSKSAGDGYYVQAGYMVTPNIQPWAEYETWSSNAASGYGGHKTWRIGATYIVEKGHRANIKLGYENFTADENIGNSNEDTIGTLLLGFFSTF